MMKIVEGTAALLFVAGLVFAGAAPAQAQAPSVTKQCGEKWAAAKAAGTTGSLTWPKFLSQCRTELAGQPAAPATASPTAAATRPARSAPSAPASTTPAPSGNAVFPTAVSSKYSNLSSGKARMQTCLDQYNANKTSNRNGGLKWIQKGGGYYSQCNARLKG